jgi:hypothetical protein
VDQDRALAEVRRAKWRRAGREVALLGLLWVFYTLTRLAVGGNLDSAIANGRDLFALEAHLHLAFEPTLNSLASRLTVLGVVAAYWYSLLHYIVTISVLVWVRRRRPLLYRRSRDILILTTLLGLVGFWLYPVAPPRLLPGGAFTDTLEAFARFGWWGADASAPRGVGHWTNEFAAMPSLHVAYAVWAAYVVWIATTNRVARLLAVAYPCATSFVVVVTANHYILDAVAGLLVVVLAAVLLRIVQASAPGISGAMNTERIDSASRSG